MTDVPSWWINTSGLFFVLASIAMIVMIALTVLLIKVVMDLQRSLQQLTQRVQALTTKVEGIADQVSTVTREVGVRTSGIVRMVDDTAASAMTIVEKLAPILMVVGAVLKIVKTVRR